MASWKKLITSGSDISQLNNDAGYITAGQLSGSQDTYTTASVNGTDLLAGTTDATLTFASSSGQGLTLSGDAGTDTITFGLSNIPNASLENSTISGISLGSNLTNLTAGSGLSSAGTYNGSTARTFTVDSASMLEYYTGSVFSTISGDVTIAQNGVSTLTRDDFTIGSTTITLGDTVTTVNGLTLTNVEATGSFTGSFTGDGSGLTGLVTDLSITADAGGTSTVDLATQTFDVAGGTNMNTSVSGQTITVNLDTSIEVTDATISGDLTVLGTASFQNTENLDVADRFIRLASGSTAAGDGGIVVQQTGPALGEAFAFDSATTRWGVTGSFDPVNSAYTPDAFMALAIEGAGSDPDTVNARFDKKGNIFVGSDEAIWIYS